MSRSLGDSKRAEISLIIINYNGAAYVEELLGSLRNQTFADFRTILIDNGSADNSCEIVQTGFPEVVVERLGRNAGFAEAGNLGVRLCDSPWVGFLNTDIRTEPTWLENLLQVAEGAPDVAGVASKMLLYSNPQVLNGVGGAMNQLGYTWDRGMLERDEGQFDTPAEVIFAPAAAALFRREAYLGIGGLDERFFMYHEDVDFGWRLWLHGYRIVTAPKAAVYHHFGATTKASKGMVWRELLGERNNIRSLLKNYEGRNVIAALARLLKLRQPRQRKVGQLRNFAWNLRYLPETLALRKNIQRRRVRSDAELASLIWQRNDVPVRI